MKTLLKTKEKLNQGHFTIFKLQEFYHKVVIPFTLLTQNIEYHAGSYQAVISAA